MERRDFRGVFERQAPRQPAPVKTADEKPIAKAAPKARGLNLERKHLVGGSAGLVLFIYIVAGLVVYALGPGSGNPIHLPFLYGYLPAASLVIPGRQGAHIIWLLVSFIAILGVIAYPASWFSRKWRDSDIRSGIGFFAIIALIWALTQAGHYMIGYNAFAARYDSLQRYQSKQLSGQQTDDQLKAQALQQVILQRYTEQEVAKYKIMVSDKDVVAQFKQSVQKAGGEAALTKQLKDYLGWTPAEYKYDLRLKLEQDKLKQKLAPIYKGEADADRKELYKSQVHAYVHGLKWNANVHNIQSADN